MSAPRLAAEGAGSARALRLCAWCVAAVAIEVLLYASYRGHDARFHWFTHFFVGASAALLVMAVLAAVRGRPVALPLVWVLVGHLFAMAPDLAFVAGVAHQPWMDVFLGHISSHFVPGRNWTWYAMFLASLGLYLLVLDGLGRGRGA
jgi:4-hydroxybenzoate polyprenyltransferase